MLRRSMLVLCVAGCVAEESSLPSSPIGSQGSELGCEGQFVLELSDTSELVRVEADGSTRTLFQLGEAAGLAPVDVVVNQWEMKGDFVGLVAFLYAPAAPPRYEYVVLDQDGNVRTHLIQEEPFNPQIYLAADGSLAVSGGHGFVLHLDGAVSDLGRYRPIAAVRGSEVLVADKQPWEPGAEFGWMNVESKAVAPLRERPSEFPTFTPIGDRVLYPAGEGRIALASPTDTRIIDTTDLGQVYPMGSTPDGRYALLAAADGQRVFRLDSSDGHLELVLKAEERVWDLSDPTLAPDGAVLKSFRLEDGQLQLRRSDDLGASWIDQGAPMAPGRDFGGGNHLVALARGERVMILNLTRGYGDFLEELQIVSPSSSSQGVAVGGLYVNGDVHPGAADLASDGSCAATWVQRIGTVFDDHAEIDLVFIEPATATSRIVRTSSRLSQLRFPPRS